MQEWLDNNDSLMYPTHNESKSVTARKFIKALKAKIYNEWQQMIANLVFPIWVN